jgi:hypothetical protein
MEAKGHRDPPAHLRRKTSLTSTNSGLYSRGAFNPGQSLASVRDLKNQSSPFFEDLLYYHTMRSPILLSELI